MQYEQRKQEAELTNVIKNDLVTQTMDTRILKYWVIEIQIIIQNKVIPQFHSINYHYLISKELIAIGIFDPQLLKSKENPMNDSES